MRYDIRPLSGSLDAKPLTTFMSGIDVGNPEDKFAHTFIAKCTMLDRWGDVLGVFTDDGALAGAILTTISKRKPHVANLQLLHTFARHRRQGVARALVEHSLRWARQNAEYFRVSSEPDAVDFYRACGLKFWGAQKSGTLLCIGRFVDYGAPLPGLVFDDCDPVVRAAVFSKRRGGVVDLFPAPT